jgi:hypothetical protein
MSNVNDKRTQPYKCVSQWKIPYVAESRVIGITLTELEEMCSADQQLVKRISVELLGLSSITLLPLGSLILMGLDLKNWD